MSFVIRQTGTNRFASSAPFHSPRNVHHGPCAFAVLSQLGTPKSELFKDTLVDLVSILITGSVTRSFESA